MKKSICLQLVIFKEPLIFNTATVLAQANNPNPLYFSSFGDKSQNMLVFLSDVINEALCSTMKPCNPNTVNAGPSNHGGKIGAFLEELIISLLDLHHHETFGNIGCGRGKFLIQTKLKVHFFGAPVLNVCEIRDVAHRSDNQAVI